MASARPGYLDNFLTPADSFYEVTRGKPHELPEAGRRQAGLTPDTWSLEIIPDDPPSPRRNEKGQPFDAFTLAGLAIRARGPGSGWPPSFYQVPRR